MRNRTLTTVFLGAFACFGAAAISTSSAEAAKQPLVFFGVNVHASDMTPRSRSALTDAIGKQVVGHLQTMGELVTVPAARELQQPCDRECQVNLAQQKHGDILGIEVTRQGAQDYDISFSLWRFDPATGRPLTEYPTQQQASCDQCTEQRMIEKVLDQVGKMLERPSSSASPAAVPPVEPPAPASRLNAQPYPSASVAPPEGERQPSSGAAHTIEATPRLLRTTEARPLSTGRQVAAGLLGSLAGLSLGGAITLQILNTQLNTTPLPDNSSRTWDFTKPYIVGYSVAGGLALIAILTAAIPSKSAPKASLVASRR